MTAFIGLTAALTLVSGVVFAAIWTGRRRAERAEFIRTWALPHGLFEKLRAKRPELSIRDCQLVGQALRQFFLAYLMSGRKFVSMPTLVTDELWHELILYTRQYEEFCQRAFGRFLHHTPAIALGSARDSNAGLRRCWWHACKAENIDPRKPTRLPLLFAIDTKLRIAGGFHYTPDSSRLQPSAGDDTAWATSFLFVSDFSSKEIDGTTDGLGDSSSGDSGDGGGGGCGGGD